MTPFTLHNGDCLAVMRTMPDASVDSIVCDPPYELTGARPGGRSAATEGKVMKGFMGMAWDGSGVAFNVDVWREALRVLKPGGHLLAFSGTRTSHRMVCAIEDAGFEIRDSVPWIFSTGFPKSRNIAAQDMVGADAERWAGWGSALKPAHEPCCMARKPLIGTVAANVLAHGTGGLNIDGCRVGTESTKRTRTDTDFGLVNDDGWKPTPGQNGSDAGRWPANLIHDGSDEVLALFPNSKGQMGRAKDDGEVSGNAVYGALRNVTTNPEPRGDTGSAARFFNTFPQSEDDPWAREQEPSNASNANALLLQQKPLDVFVLCDAVNSALPEELHSSPLSMEPFIAATPNELRLIGEAATQAIRSIASEFWRGQQLGSFTLSLNHASAVVARNQIGTTTITISHWKSDGSAANATFSIMQRSLEAGARDFEPSAADRFIYCAKAGRADRNDGTDRLPQKKGGMVSNTSGQHLTRRDDTYVAPLSGNHHPTVKPTALMAHLVRLVTPPGGLVLDPFMGSGSTGKACMREGFRFIGIDLSAEYVEIARARIEHEIAAVATRAAAAQEAADLAARQIDLFAEAP